MARTKGSLKQIKMDAQAKANELGIDPFEVLLLFSANRWSELGYEKRTQTKCTAEGYTFEVDLITPELRVKAAQEATNYILSKRKSIEFDIKELPEQALEQEITRRVHLKILNGELKASDVA